MIRVIVVRHGATEWNQEGRYQGHTDVALSDLGRWQAGQLGGRLAREAISTAYCSDLRRARETAEIVLQGRPVALTLTPALREARFGAWEGLRFAEIADRYPREWSAWAQTPAQARPPGGGESLEEVRRRVVEVYRDIVDHGLGTGHGGPSRTAGPADWFAYRAAGSPAQDPGRATVLLVTHGGPLRALLTHVFDMPVDLYWRFGARPASVTILEVYLEGAVAEVIGDTSHLSEQESTP